MFFPPLPTLPARAGYRMLVRLVAAHGGQPGGPSLSLCWFEKCDCSSVVSAVLLSEHCVLGVVKSCKLDCSGDKLLRQTWVR